MMRAAASDSPQLAILFWYYKAPAICCRRLAELRRLHPTTAIYGLYGGDPGQIGDFAELRTWLDDAWCYDSAQPEEWKWRHGDLMIAEWFDKRGRDLAWDSIAVVQWDMLVCRPLDQVFSPLDRDEVYLPGVRPVSEVEGFWWWAKPGTPQRAEMDAFEAGLRQRHRFGALQGCQFVCAVFSRRFLELYGSMPDREIGFLEYKLPSCVLAFGMSLRDYPQLKVSWQSDPHETRPVVLSARKGAIRARDILLQRLVPGGARLFHPVHAEYPHGLFSIAASAAGEGLRTLKHRLALRLKSSLSRPRERL